jgi:hypothetical protein
MQTSALSCPVLVALDRDGAVAGFASTLTAPAAASPRRSKYDLQTILSCPIVAVIYWDSARALEQPQFLFNDHALSL